MREKSVKKGPWGGENIALPIKGRKEEEPQLGTLHTAERGLRSNGRSEERILQRNGSQEIAKPAVK